MLNIPELVNEEDINNFMKTISANVKRIREEKKMSQLEVALSIGQKSGGFYANAENFAHGKHFNLVHLYKLSVLFDIDINEFFKN
ncbi:helix-turn-helix transcriptional regulator [Sulfurimonas sp.]|uniref:helix-turn-helix transcriptional regulator n=1 Tax=Sulfurimonas sp. TaxID=2022749 RepID=UPI003D0A44CF